MDLNEAPATGATPTMVSKRASEHLGLSIDAALSRQHRRDVGTMLVSLACAAMGVGSIVALVAYMVGGAR